MTAPLVISLSTRSASAEQTGGIEMATNNPPVAFETSAGTAVWRRLTTMVTAIQRHRGTRGPGYLEAGVIAREQFRL